MNEEVHDSRLSRLEAVVENIAHEVSDLKDIVMSSSKTNWSTLASWAAVLLAIVSILGSSYVKDIARLEVLEDISKKEIVTLKILDARRDERLKVLENERQIQMEIKASAILHK